MYNTMVRARTYHAKYISIFLESINIKRWSMKKSNGVDQDAKVGGKISGCKIKTVAVTTPKTTLSKSFGAGFFL